MLRANHTLTSLSLFGNLLSDAATVSIASSLSSNGALTALDLGRNYVSSVGAQALRAALHANQSLVSLDDLSFLPISVGLRSSLQVRNIPSICLCACI